MTHTDGKKGSRWIWTLLGGRKNRDVRLLSKCESVDQDADGEEVKNDNWYEQLRGEGVPQAVQEKTTQDTSGFQKWNSDNTDTNDPVRREIFWKPTQRSLCWL